ncbi:MAG TPA: hypothetical protein VGE21_12435 [Flavobacteriales bacterium]
MLRLFPLLALVFTLSPALQAQTYFYVDQIEVEPAAPTTADDISISLIGNLSSSGSYVVSATAQVMGNTVQLTVVSASTGGLSVLVPHTETIPIGQLAAGTYAILVQGSGTDDFAPEFQHSFIVSGGGPCDDLEVLSVSYGAFSDTLVEVVVDNNSTTEIFSYPAFVLFDANGDTLAVETDITFALVDESTHYLRIHDDAVLPTGPFTGTLELWTLFYEELSCSFEMEFDLCPAPPCSPLIVSLQNLGGGSTEGSFGWTLFQSGEPTATGQFVLGGDVQYDADTLCMAPGGYELSIDQSGEVPLGQLYVGVGIGGLHLGQQMALNWAEPMPLVFDFHPLCSEGGQSVGEVEASAPILLRHTAEGFALDHRQGEALGLITVFDAQGRKVLERSTPNSSLMLNTAAWAEGAYVLHVQGRDGAVQVLRGVVVR